MAVYYKEDEMVFKNLSDMNRTELVPGFHVKFIHSERMTFAYWDVLAGAVLPEHTHPHEQVVNMVEGEFQLTVDGEAKILKKGDVAMIPPNAPHSAKALTDCKIIDVFAPVREDYRDK